MAILDLVVLEAMAMFGGENGKVCRRRGSDDVVDVVVWWWLWC